MDKFSKIYIKKQKLFRKIVERAMAVPIFFKIMGIAFGLIILFCIGALIETRILLYKSLKNQVEEKGIAISKDLANKFTDLIIAENLFGIYELLKETMNSHKDLKYIFVLDKNSHVIAHTFEHKVSDDIIKANTLNFNTMLTGVNLKTLDAENGKIFDILVPIFEGRLGSCRVGLMDTSLREALGKATKHLLISIIIMAVIGVFISYLLTYILNRPLSKLGLAVNEVSNGNLKTRVDITTNDEFGNFGRVFNSMVENLEKNQLELKQKEELRQELIEKIIFTQEEERNRIARELHDKTGQTLTSLKIGLKSLETGLSSEDMKHRLENFRVLLNTSLEDIHNLAVELRPPLLDDFGFFKAVKTYIKEFENKFDIKVKYKISGYSESAKLPSTIEIGLYRVIQEAFTNIVKHAKAKEVSIAFQKENNQGANLLLIIEDNGVGFDINRVNTNSGRRPIGVFGMQERIYILGGKFKIESKVNNGTKIFIEVPVK